MADSHDSQRIARRRFLQLMAGSGSTLLLAACGAAPAPSAEQPTAAPDAPAATSAPEAPAATSAPTVASGGSAVVRVMMQRAEFSEDQQKAFEDANSDIKLEFIESDMTTLFAAAAAGNPPDIIRVQAPDIPQLIARNMLLDLTSFFAASSVLKIDDLAPANNYYKANSPTEIGEGAIYGMVKDWSPDFTLYAYKTAFEEAGIAVPDPATPLTYAELATLAEQLTVRDGDRTTRWGFSYALDWIDRIMMNQLAETGQKLYSDDFSSLNLSNNEEARKIAQYFFDLSQANHTPNPLNPSPSWPGDDFTKGMVGIVQYGYWFSAMAESDITKDQVVMLPAPTWAGTRLDPTITATGLVMSSQTKNPDAAWRVFEWYNADQPALDRFASGWGVPSLVSKYDLLPTETPFQQQAKTVLEGELPYSEQPVQFNPYLSGSAFYTVWTKHLEGALRDEMSFDQFLQNVEQEVNQAILDGQDRIG
jgi:multiple sugar transport system substrate-binding protein